jgi:ABC-type Fe3+ transport system permease subunit
MRGFFRNRYLQNSADDIRHFMRNPGLMTVTAVLVVLILIFIVYPIGSVLIKSFSVSYPTVTLRYETSVAGSADVDRLVTHPLLGVLKNLQGLESARAIGKSGSFAIHLRFQRDWDDLKGLNDAKRSIRAIQGQLDPHVRKFTYRLGKESVYSLASYRDFFSNSYYYRALRNSIVLALVSTALVTFFAFCFAYLGLKGPDFLKGALRVMGLVPLIAPPFIFALALILIGGRMGIFTKLLHLPFNIYGWPGVIIAQVITFLPLGYLMIENVLRSLGTNLEDAASDMRASDVDILFKITIPLAAPGILKAGLLVFLMSIADFGNPMLIGGGVSFLATDAYFLWMSENNLEMAAVFCDFLVLPSMLMFIIHEYILKGRVYTTIGGKPQQSEKRRMSGKIFYPMLAIVTPLTIMIVLCFGMIFIGAFTKILMVDNSFTLEHFQSSNGFYSLVTSLKFAFSAALIAPIIGVWSASASPLSASWNSPPCSDLQYPEPSWASAISSPSMPRPLN